MQSLNFDETWLAQRFVKEMASYDTALVYVEALGGDKEALVEKIMAQRNARAEALLTEWKRMLSSKGSETLVALPESLTRALEQMQENENMDFAFQSGFDPYATLRPQLGAGDATTRRIADTVRTALQEGKADEDIRGMISFPHTRLKQHHQYTDGLLRQITEDYAMPGFIENLLREAHGEAGEQWDAAGFGSRRTELEAAYHAGLNEAKQEFSATTRRTCDEIRNEQADHASRFRRHHVTLENSR